LETTNVSVGRGTDTPFEVLGAPWINERKLARMIGRANLPGVRVVPIRFTPTASKFEGQECGGLNFIVTDWDEFRSFDLGLTVAHALRKLHGDKWEAKGYMRLLGNEEVHRRLRNGDEVESILQYVQEQTTGFRDRRKQFELYEW
jgi:uncharacterized protein YbbC (DUF1343 family)